MIIYKIEHTESGYSITHVRKSEADTADYIADHLSWCEVGDTMQIAVVEMTEEEYEALPEFEGAS